MEINGRTTNEYSMTAFETYLIEKGFVKHRYDFKQEKYIPFNGHALSTMGDIHYMYSRGSQKILFGLNESGKPPTLKSPRPVIINGSELFEATDDMINRMLNNLTPENILSIIFDENKYREALN